MEDWDIPPTTKGLLDAIPSKGRILSTYSSDQRRKDLIQKGIIKSSSTGDDNTLSKKYWQNAEETLADRLVELGRSNIEYAHLHNTTGKEIWHGPTETSKQAQQMGKGLLTLIKSEDVDYNYRQDIERFKSKKKMNKKEQKANMYAEKALEDKEESALEYNNVEEKNLQSIRAKKILNNTRMNVVSITYDPHYVEATNIKRVETSWKTSLYTTEEVCMSCNLLIDEIFNSTNQKRIELCCTMLKILCKRHVAARELLLRDMEGFLQAAYPKYVRSGNEKGKRLSYVVEALSPFYATELSGHSCIQKILRISLLKAKLAIKLIHNQSKRKKALQIAKSYPKEVKQKMIFNLNLLSEDLRKQWKTLVRSDNSGEPTTEYLNSYLNTLLVLSSKSNLHGESERNMLFRINRKIIVQEGGLILLSTAYAHSSSVSIRLLAEKILLNLSQEVILLMPLLKSCLIQTEFIPFINEYSSFILKSRENIEESSKGSNLREKKDGNIELLENREKLRRILRILERFSYSAYLYSKKLKDKNDYQAFKFQDYDPDEFWLQRPEDMDSFLNDDQYFNTKVVKQDSLSDEDDIDDEESEDRTGQKKKNEKHIFNEKNGSQNKKGVLYDEYAFETSSKIRSVMEQFLFQDDLIQSIIQVIKLGEEDLLLQCIRILHNLACSFCYDKVLDNIMKTASKSGIKIIIDALHCPNVDVLGHCSLLLLQLASTNEGRGQMIGNGVADFLKIYLQHKKAHWNMPYLFAMRILIQLCSEVEDSITFPPQVRYAPDVMTARYAIYQDLFDISELSTNENILHTGHYLWKLGIDIEFLDFFTKDYKDVTTNMPERHITMRTISRLLSAVRIRSAALSPHIIHQLIVYCIHVFDMDINEAMDTAEYEKELMPTLLMGIESSSQCLTILCNNENIYEDISQSKVNPKNIILEHVSDSKKTNFLKDIRDLLHSSHYKCPISKTGSYQSNYQIKRRTKILSVTNVAALAVLRAITPVPFSENNSVNLTESQKSDTEESKVCDALIGKFSDLYHDSILSILKAYKGKFSPLVTACIQTLKSFSVTYDSASTLFKKGTLDILMKYLPKEHVISSLDASKSVVLQGMEKKLVPAQYAALKELVTIPPSFWGFLASLARVQSFRVPLYKIGVLKFALERIHIVSECDSHDRYVKNEIFMLLARCAHIFIPRTGTLDDLILGMNFETTSITIRALNDDYLRYNAMTFACSMMRDLMKGVPSFCKAGVIPILLSYTSNYNIPHPILRRTLEAICMITKHPNRPYNDALITRQFRKDLFHIANCRSYNNLKIQGIIPISDLASYIIVLINKTGKDSSDTSLAGSRNINTSTTDVSDQTDGSSGKHGLINTEQEIIKQSNTDTDPQKFDASFTILEQQLGMLPAHSFRVPNGNKFDCGVTKCGSLMETYNFDKGSQLPEILKSKTPKKTSRRDISSKLKTNIDQINGHSDLSAWRKQYRKTLYETKVDKGQSCTVTFVEKNINPNDDAQLRGTRPTGSIPKKMKSAKIDDDSSFKNYSRSDFNIPIHSKNLTLNSTAAIRGCERVFLNDKLLMTNPNFDCVGETEQYLKVIKPVLKDPVPIIHEEGKESEPHFIFELERNHGVYPKRDIYNGASGNEPNIHEYATARYAAVLSGKLDQY